MDELTKFLPWLAALAPVVLFYSHVRTFASKIFSIAVVKVQLKGRTGTAFNYYLSTYGKFYPLGSAHYNASSDYSQIDKKKIAIGYEEIGGEPQFARVDNSVFFITNENNKESKYYSPEAINVYYLRGTVNHEELIIKALDFYNSRAEHSRFKIYIKTGMGNKSVVADRESLYAPRDPEDLYKHHRILKYNRSEIGYNQDRAEITTGYVFCAAVNRMYEECRRWFESEQWYRSRSILWRRGFMLHGVPGSGKTSAVRKICQLLDIPLFVFDLASMSNQEFLSTWEECQTHSPCAVLYDDIDKVFNKQENIAGETGGGLSFDAFITALSGAKPVEGVLVFCTVNDLSKVDETLGQMNNQLVTRPGRIDSIIEIGLMEEENRRALAKSIFSGSDIDIEPIIKKGEGMTAAQFSDLCTNLSLDIYWKNKTNT